MAMNANAETMLTPHQAAYTLQFSVLGGQLNTELRVTPDGYVATHVVKPTGMAKLLASGQISETSQFRSTDDGIRPVKYRSDDSLSRDKTEASIEFNWETGEASGTVDDQAVSSIMEEIAYDRVSIQYELMFDLMNGGPSSQYILFDIDELKTVIVSNIGSRPVKVPAGKF